MSYLLDFKEFNRGYVTFRGGANGGRITGTEETIGKGDSSKETGSSQDYILMPLWKDGLLFDSSLKNATNDESQSSCDAKNKDDNGVNKDSGIDAHEKSANSINDVNTVGPSINTASTDFDTGSLNINTFWKSATIRTLKNEDMEITATIDGKVKVVTKASVRRHLKLEDSKGISVLPTTGEGSTVLVESHHTPIGDPSTSPPHLSSPPRSSIRQKTEVPQPSSPTHTYVADEAASTGVDVRHGGAATTVTSLDTGHGSGNINKTPSMPHDSPLSRVNTLRSDEGIYGAAYTKIIIKVKRLEKTVKTGKARRKAQIVVFDDGEEFEDPSKQGRSMIEEINQDTKVTLFTPTQVLTDVAKVHTYTRRRKAVNTGSDGISTASRIVSIAEESGSTAGASMLVSTAGMIDKAVRLQEQFDEEERQRIARVHEAAQTFTEEEWENIRARVEADEELIKYLAIFFNLVPATTLHISSFNSAELFEATMRIINDFVPMESEDDKEVPKLAEARSSKRDAEEELKHE
uniref:Uncharacterized protein n=1 Tax=Tanacetum cinerariifolium TaxID=118510 RepID=A0A6L2KK25_TANCI|nr:hypothetical protein [Tanacetum cinerariifolium]